MTLGLVLLLILVAAFTVGYMMAGPSHGYSGRRGRQVPKQVAAANSRDDQVERLRDMYANDEITLDEFRTKVDQVLHGGKPTLPPRDPGIRSTR